MRIESLAEDAGLELEWNPFLLGPLFKDVGWNTSPFIIYPTKGRYMWRDMERLCKLYEIPLRKPSIFPQNGLLAARVACSNAGRSWLPDFVRAVYLANFAHDRDISKPEVIAEVLEDLNLDAKSLIQQTQSPESKALLRTRTEKAKELGLFGAPTVMVDEEMFWGNDRLEQAVDWALNCTSQKS